MMVMMLVETKDGMDVVTKLNLPGSGSVPQTLFV